MWIRFLLLNIFVHFTFITRYFSVNVRTNIVKITNIGSKPLFFYRQLYFYLFLDHYTYMLPDNESLPS